MPTHPPRLGEATYTCPHCQEPHELRDGHANTCRAKPRFIRTTCSPAS